MSENVTESPKHAPADVGAQELAKVYAEALLNAADKRGNALEVIEELASLVNVVLARQPQLEEIFASRAITRERKEALIHAAFEGRASETFTNFLYVLNNHDRLDLPRAIHDAVAKLWNERTGRVPVQVTSARPLESAQLETLRQEIRTKFNKEPLIEAAVEADLLGGIVVQVGDWLYDASVRSRIQRLRQQLIESSSHAIQTGRDRFYSDE